MNICANGKIYNVQSTEAHGMVVQRNGKTLFNETRGYQIAVAEFKRIAEDNAYAANEAALRSA